MQRITRFIKNIVYSATKAEFYHKVLKAPLSFSLKYFCLLILLLSLVYTGFWEFKFLPEFSKILDTGIAKIESLYPENMTLTINQGVLSTNQNKPFVLPLSSIYKDTNTQSTQMPTPTNLLVIDTQTPFSEIEYRNRNTLIWLTKTSMIYPDNNYTSGGVRILPFTDFKEKFVLDKKTVNTAIASLKPVLKNVINVVAFSFLPVVFLFLLLYKLSALLWTGIIVFILAKIAKYKFSFSKSYQLALHASTLPLLLETFFTLSGIPVLIPFWYTLLSLILLFYFVRKTPTTV